MCFVKAFVRFVFKKKSHSILNTKSTKFFHKAHEGRLKQRAVAKFIATALCFNLIESHGIQTLGLKCRRRAPIIPHDQKGKHHRPKHAPGKTQEKDQVEADRVGQVPAQDRPHDRAGEDGGLE